MRIQFGVIAVIVMGALAPLSARSQSLNLQNLLLDVLSNGVTLSTAATGDNHAAHFTADSEAALGANDQFLAVSRLNTEIGRQLSSFPLSSSAGSFSYEFDATLGVLTRPTQSFGSVYTERPFTVGQGKYNLGVSFAQFSFDRLDDLLLRDGDLRLVFLHEDADGDGRVRPFFEGDIVAADLFIDLDVNVTTIAATYGVRDRLDVGLVIPVVDVSLDVLTDANVLALASGSGTHLFSNGTTSKTTRRGGHAQGVGDVSLRARWLPSAFGADDFRTGVTGEIRFPTGDERNLLGTGATQFKASVLFSKPMGALGVHGIMGVGGGTEDIPVEVQYAGGADWTVDPKLTLAFDVLGRTVDEQPEIQVADRTYEYNTATDGSVVLDRVDLPTLDVDGGSLSKRSELTASVGFKLNVWDTFLLTANGLFPLNEVGLRDDFSTLIGVDYSF
ncbi:MAG: hypothetical protein DHS20C21_16020 [Gemmatimonadota bacterium]|nr:MAG: hypothetical protein DHS20C21_16020 [Gemmatimonadota bacterium]